MERLTYDFCIGGNHYWKVKGADNLECREVCERQEESGCKTCPIANAFDRLAAYENTGLEPQEIKSLQAEWQANLKVLESYRELGVPVDRLRELVEADRGGRCVVLPCKVGESLWIHDKDGKPREMILDEPDIRCHCKEEDNLCMVLCRAKHTGVCAMRLRNDGSSIGKTVFLTREEAEAALEEMKNG